METLRLPKAMWADSPPAHRSCSPQARSVTGAYFLCAKPWVMLFADEVTSLYSLANSGDLFFPFFRRETEDQDGHYLLKITG